MGERSRKGGNDRTVIPDHCPIAVGLTLPATAFGYNAWMSLHSIIAGPMPGAFDEMESSFLALVVVVLIIVEAGIFVLYAVTKWFK